MNGISCPITIDGHQYVYGITHNSKFHSDEVFSTALLTILARHQNMHTPAPHFMVAREPAAMATRIANEVDNVLVYDIGNTKYDHHMEPRATRDNGIAYAAFGKLWGDVGPELGFSDMCVEIFDRDFVQFIDNHDNHGVLNPISLVISSMNTDDYTDDDQQRIAFDQAVEYAISTLRPLLADLRKRDNGIYPILTKGNVVTRDTDTLCAVVYDEALRPDWVSDVRREEVMIYPHGRGGWAIEALRSHINNSPESYNRVIAPALYRGKPAEDLARMYPNMKFCHASGFLTTFETKEDAIKFFRSADWEILKP